MVNYKIKILIIFLTALCLTGGSFAVESQRQIEHKRQVAQKRIHTLKLLEKIETNKLYKNQQKLERTQDDLSKNQQKLERTQGNLQNLKNELKNSLQDYENQKNSANRRITSIYKTQRKNYIEFLLNAHDLNNLLDRLYFENLLMRLDREKIKSTQRKTRNILAIKQRIEVQQHDLDTNIKIMSKQQEHIKNAIGKNEKYIEKLKTDRATWEKSEKELAKQSAQLTRLINKSVKGEKDIIIAGGSFLRPIGGRVSSPYGYRIHPIFKRRVFHSGVDLASGAGTPIKAANNGKIIFSGWYGGYGKVVIIDHGKIGGKNTTTLYAHMSSIGVGQGQNVQRGQVIGRVGSTGYSTGPHLHFEVRVNGKTTNPFNYIPR